MIDKDKLKRGLTIDNIYDIVTSLGAAPVKVHDILIMDTICHNYPGMSNGKKLYYYPNTCLFHCYTQCGESFDIFDLIIKVKMIQEQQEWELFQAIMYVMNFMGYSQNELTNFDNQYIDDWNILDYLNLINSDKIELVHEYTPYDEKILTFLPFIPCKDWINEGITIETMQKYGIKYYPTDCKMVIPHWDKNNVLIGIRGRTLAEEDMKFGKYMPIKMNNILYSHPLSFNLYGLNFNKNNIRNMKKVIIFEGEKSVMIYESFYGFNISVASCGSSISQAQIKLLQDLGVEEIIIAYDKQFQTLGDEEYYKEVKLLTSLANKIKNFCNVSIIFDKYNLLGYKEAPVDRGKEVFEKLFATRIMYWEGIK